jgi:hypothetical protein
VHGKLDGNNGSVDVVMYKIENKDIGIQAYLVILHLGVGYLTTV